MHVEAVLLGLSAVLAVTCAAGQMVMPFRGWTDPMNVSSWIISRPIERGVCTAIYVVHGGGGDDDPRDSSLCVPPKAGSMAASAVFRNRRLEDVGDVAHQKMTWRGRSNLPEGRSAEAHAKILELVVGSETSHVAIIRHPVERVLSSLSSFGARAAGCKECNSGNRKDWYLIYATKYLPLQQALPCSVAKLEVNQHFRSQRCFCAFDLVGQLERTHVLKHGVADDMRRLPDLIPNNAHFWNARIYGSHKNLTAVEYLSPQNLKETTVHAKMTHSNLMNVEPHLLAALSSALQVDEAYFGFKPLFQNNSTIEGL